MTGFGGSTFALTGSGRGVASAVSSFNFLASFRLFLSLSSESDDMSESEELLTSFFFFFFFFSYASSLPLGSVTGFPVVLGAHTF